MLDASCESATRVAPVEHKYEFTVVLLASNLRGFAALFSQASVL